MSTPQTALAYQLIADFEHAFTHVRLPQVFRPPPHGERRRPDAQFRT